MESELLLHFEKEVEEIPWGFRLTGGVDFNEPLTVVKVRSVSSFFFPFGIAFI